MLSWWFSVGDIILGLRFVLCNAFYCCWHKRHVEYATGDGIGFYQRGNVVERGDVQIDSAWYRSRYPWDYWFVLIFNNSRPNKEISKRLIWPTEPSKWLYLGYSNTNTPTVVDQYEHPTYKISIAYKMWVLCGQIFSWIYLVSKDIIKFGVLFRDFDEKKVL